MCLTQTEERALRRSKIMASAICGAAAGASVGSVIGPVSTVVSSLIGLIAIPILLNALGHYDRPDQHTRVDPDNVSRTG